MTTNVETQLTFTSGEVADKIAYSVSKLRRCIQRHAWKSHLSAIVKVQYICSPLGCTPLPALTHDLFYFIGAGPLFIVFPSFAL